ncbi:MAG: hypothetical protein PUP46_01775 [Endozoicomonas sp. (ex Botrylloides leachii)]|nr:hypothetical protein [Endozoicomonas sp. (ex Botrylloides leachii)]
MSEYVRNNNDFAKPKDFRQKINDFLNVTLPEIRALLAGRINENFQIFDPAS